MTRGLRWGDFAVAAPDLATHTRAIIAERGFVYLGTIRRDGSPRISPVEVHLVGGELMVVLVPKTQKARDVVRGPRVVLQSPVSGAADPGSELKLSGRAIVVVDEAQRDATAAEIETASGWRPHPSWLFASVAIESVAILEWESGEMVLARWDESRGTRGPERRRLDSAAGAYAKS